MNRLLGIFLMVALLYAILMGSDENARTLSNQQTIASRLGFYGVLTVGVGILIVSGGIDLSIGSVIGLTAVLFGVMLEKEIPPWQAALVVLSVAAFIGLLHGLLVTRVGLQPFLVTLCGLFIYRGLAKWLAPDHSPGWHVEGAPALQEQIRGFREQPSCEQPQTQVFRNHRVGRTIISAD